jgi:hypothetical protein
MCRSRSGFAGVARTDRWSLEAGEGGGVLKNVSSRRKGMVATKSAGVVSDMNQGMSFGLHTQILLREELKVSENVLKDNFGHMVCIGDQEISQDQICKQLHFVVYPFRLSSIRKVISAPQTQLMKPCQTESGLSCGNVPLSITKSTLPPFMALTCSHTAS